MGVTSCGQVTGILTRARERRGTTTAPFAFGIRQAIIRDQMRRFLTLTLGIVLCYSVLNAQEHKQPETPQTPESKLMQFQMALMKRGPKWSPDPSRERAAMRQRHI